MHLQNKCDSKSDLQRIETELKCEAQEFIGYQ